MTSATKPTPYGCHNQPRPIAGAVTHMAQDGWAEFTDLTGHPVRMPRWTEIRQIMSTDCRYITKTPDPRCAGCQHINQGTV